MSSESYRTERVKQIWEPVLSSHIRGLRAVTSILNLPCWDLQSWDKRVGIIGDERAVLSIVLL